MSQGPFPSEYAIRVPSTRHAIWKKLPSLLERLDLELTERCNNQCIHCFINRPAGDVPARKRELTTAEIKGILAEAAELGALAVRFTGGEPLLREDFPEIYRWARRQGLKVFLFTNGRLITREIADLVAEIPPLERIEISVYGMSRRSYEAVTRVPGAYAEFLRGVERLKERKIPFMVKGTLLPPNIHELDAFEAWAAQLSGDKKPHRLTFFLSLRGRRDSEEQNRRIQELRLSPQEILPLLTRERYSYLEEMKSFCSRFIGPPGTRLFTCGAGVRTGCVDAYGKLQLCLMLRHPDTVYDLRNGSLREALTEFFPRLRKRRAQDVNYLARCGRCFLKGLCEQCPAYSWGEYGVLDKPVEYLCQVAHTQAHDLGLLRINERAWEVKNWRPRKISATAPLGAPSSSRKGQTLAPEAPSF